MARLKLLWTRLFKLQLIHILVFFSVGDLWTASLTVDLNSPATPSSGLGSHAGAITDGSLTVLSNNFTFDLWGQEYINLDTSLPNTGATMAYASTDTVNSQSYHIVDFIFYDWDNLFANNLE